MFEMLNETKEQIKKAAFQLFSQKGIHGTNSKEIAKKAGVSIGSFYSYFKNKKILLLEILEDHCDQVFSSIWQPLNGFIVNDQAYLDGIRHDELLLAILDIR